MSYPKWLPKDLQGSYHLFTDLDRAAVTFKWLTNRYLNEITFDEPDVNVVKHLTKLALSAFQKSDELQTKVTKAYVKQPGDKRIDRNPYNQLVAQKAMIILGNLQQKQCQLVFIMRKQVNALLQVALNADGFVDDALVMAAAHNKCIEFMEKFNFGGAAQICSISYTTIFLPPSRIDVKDILQAVTTRRSEQCCLQLITSLLVTCQIDGGSESDSDTSSIEVLKALTSHMSSGASPLNDDTQLSAAQDPSMAFFDKMASIQQSAEDNLKNDGNIDHLEKMVSTEENYFAFILLKSLQLCPSIFETQPSQEQIVKKVNKATQSLWTQTGATLEHVVLWWCNTPLDSTSFLFSLVIMAHNQCRDIMKFIFLQIIFQQACQPVAVARHLRDWLLNLQYDEAPETLVSVLRCLGETLTVHVACCLWDKQFRLALVASSLAPDYNFKSEEFYTKKTRLEGTTTTGRLWSELLYTLTTFCNNCDQHSTIPNELPIVEQIAVLHRLDHSIHTMRLWAAAKSKTLCIDWCMDMFFKVVHNDINQCLEQIKLLRTPDLVAPDLFEVEIQVNVALRAKLISEVKVNICKLKLTSSECIEVLAAVCKMLSLATLSLCFPKSQFWQSNLLQEGANDYVNKFLTDVYLPVVKATDVLEILNLILRIMCEAWLDHIYTQKIKFSREGALNLLRDFEGVSEWIIACKDIQPEHVDILAKHEVLRTCEGVGKILLRKPFEIIPMTEQLPYTPRVQPQKPSEPEGETLLPPEMFVPNQIRWLELRARNRNRLNSIMCICAGRPCIT